jgi:hypothetical protein
MLEFWEVRVEPAPLVKPDLLVKELVFFQIYPSIVLAALST